MNARRLQIEVLRSAIAVYRIRDLILAHFERSASRADVVRASDLDALVASTLDTAVNNALRIKVRQAMRLAGWRAVRPGNVPTYRHCRRRAAS